MNEQTARAQEQTRLYLEAHDADIRHATIAEVRASLDVFFAELESTLKVQLIAVRDMREKLMDKPATPAPKRKRAKSVATDKQVEAVKDVIRGAEGYTNRGLPINTIAEMSSLGPRITANACKQLEAQGWIKCTDDGYRWIPEKEAERENGLRTGPDDGAETE